MHDNPCYDLIWVRKEVVMVLEDLFRSPSALMRFRMPPLGPQMDDFCQWLSNQGYCRPLLRQRIWQVSHFNQYLRGLKIEEGRGIERSHAQRFVSKHLPHCRCGGRSTSKKGVARSIHCLMDYLSERGLLHEVAETAPAYQKVLDEYLVYLKRDRNLAEVHSS